MLTRVFRAATMKQALEQVRRDLGGGAVILGTRELRRRRFLGMGPARDVIEVRAAEAHADNPRGRWHDSSLRVDPGAALASTASLHAQVGEQLGRLHAMVSELAKQGRVDHVTPDLPSEIVPIYAALIEADVPEVFARRLARRAAERVEPDQMGDNEALGEALLATVAECLPIAPPIAVPTGTRRVVALVGPTGVGKTTTVAKLAAAFKLIHGLSPGLVTADTYRIAAVEQLRTYAEIIDVPLAVANTAREMPGALESLGKVDVVLIDTAGRSPRDDEKVQELGEMLRAARPDEIHLVLSTNAGVRSLQAAVDRFKALSAERLILTKLDECEGLGGILALVAHADLPISYITTGQAVPDDIEAADRERLARLILDT